MIRHQENDAYEVLAMLDLHLWQLKNLIERKKRAGDDFPDQADKLSPSEHAEKCLKAMYLEANKMGHTVPGSLHLLLSLLALDNGIGVYWLRTKGVTDQTLRAHLKGEIRLNLKATPAKRPVLRKSKNDDEDVNSIADKILNDARRRAGIKKPRQRRQRHAHAGCVCARFDRRSPCGQAGSGCVPGYGN